MAQLITLTPTPITVSATGKENLWEAFDMSMFDMLDMTLGILSSSGGTAGNNTIQLITSMQREIEDNSWIATSTNFANVAYNATYPNWQLINLNMGFLRYMRWNVSGLATGATITFIIQGMARRYSG